MEMKEKGGRNVFNKTWVIWAMLFLISWCIVNHLKDPNIHIVNVTSSSDPSSLEKLLERASMKNKTVIITALNAAWAEPNSIFDLFRESFRKGNQTEELLKHVVVITMDQKAYIRCLELHPHCYKLSNGTNSSGEAYFMTKAYLEIIWTRVEFLLTVVEHGYSFIFTDMDIMWFRDPFPQFFPDADFQTACDSVQGNSTDLRNMPNGGFTYTISNNRSIEFYKFWYASRLTFPNIHEQDVFNKIKFDPYITKDIGLKIRFLDPKYFGGFCSPSDDLNQVCTMHANCCYGLENKVYDLNILLQDWTRYLSAKTNGSLSQEIKWNAPQKCRSPYHPPDSPKS